MSPWDILGWMLIALIAIPFAIVIVALLMALLNATRGVLAERIKYYMTRNIPPAEGQLWNQNGSTLKIGDKYDDGRFVVRIGNSSWIETPADWKKRVRNRKLYLISQPKKEQ